MFAAPRPAASGRVGSPDVPDGTAQSGRPSSSLLDVGAGTPFQRRQEHRDRRIDRTGVLIAALSPSAAIGAPVSVQQENLVRHTSNWVRPARTSVHWAILCPPAVICSPPSSNRSCTVKTDDVLRGSNKAVKYQASSCAVGRVKILNLPSPLPMAC